jgi:hypothetical protein
MKHLAMLVLGAGLVTAHGSWAAIGSKFNRDPNMVMGKTAVNTAETCPNKASASLTKTTVKTVASANVEQRAARTARGTN